VADMGGDLWRAVLGRVRGPAPQNIRDAVDRLEAAGASRKDIAAFKKDLAAALGVSVRQVQRMSTRTGRETRSDRRHAGAIREFVGKDPRVRSVAGSRRRKSRMRNKGAWLKIKGWQGPKVGKSWPTRDRTVELDLDGYQMEAILGAWSRAMMTPPWRRCRMPWRTRGIRRTGLGKTGPRSSSSACPADDSSGAGLGWRGASCKEEVQAPERFDPDALFECLRAAAG
jgi:hypothetical protein